MNFITVFLFGLEATVLKSLLKKLRREGLVLGAANRTFACDDGRFPVCIVGDICKRVEKTTVKAVVIVGDCN